MKTLLDFDQRQLASTDMRLLIGIDEAGRGALAGPVVAGSVCLSPGCYTKNTLWPPEVMINDSKQLTPSQRETVFAHVNQLRAEDVLCAETAMASVEEIEQHNILGATRLAMKRALEKVIKVLCTKPLFFPNQHVDVSLQASSSIALNETLVLIDGRPLRPFPYAHQSVIKGDGKSLAIALASICAKVVRDSHMIALHEHYSHYGFAQHKGYGTIAHRKAICAHGPLALHRKHFIRKVSNNHQQMLIKTLS